MHVTHKILAIVGTHTLSFREFLSCGVLEYFGQKEPISSRRWLADMMNAFWLSFYPKSSKVRLLLSSERHSSRLVGGGGLRFGR